MVLTSKTDREWSRLELVGSVEGTHPESCLEKGKAKGLGRDSQCWTDCRVHSLLLSTPGQASQAPGAVLTPGHPILRTTIASI